jgi:hypothetical protein
MVILSALVAFGLTTGSMAFGDDELKDKELGKPENLSSQVIDRGSSDGKSETTADEAKPSEDDTKREVPHFAGHAFSE